MLRTTLVFVLSIMCGLCGTVALAVVADWRQWCCVNGWAMMHDTGPAVFLLSVLAGYHLVSTIGAKGRHLPPSWPPGWLAHTAYVASALGTVWSLSAFGGVWSNYSFMAIGVVTGSLAVVLKIRGRTVRQFDIIASLIVSCFTMAAAAAEGVVRHPTTVLITLVPSRLVARQTGLDVVPLISPPAGPSHSLDRFAGLWLGILPRIASLSYR